MKILVVEDEPASLQAVSQLLTENGYAVVTAGDGPGAIQVALAEQPDLMLLDLGLPSNDPFGPQIDGFGVMDWLKHFQEGAKIPVIVLTSLEPAIAKQHSLECGAIAYFQKPADPEQLLSAVRIALGEDAP
jgi:DNA-binding response OmpR family regulator